MEERRYGQRYPVRAYDTGRNHSRVKTIKLREPCNIQNSVTRGSIILVCTQKVRKFMTIRGISIRSSTLPKLCTYKFNVRTQNSPNTSTNSTPHHNLENLIRICKSLAKFMESSLQLSIIPKAVSMPNYSKDLSMVSRTMMALLSGA